MQIIKTSYFANLKNLSAYVPISISRYSPSWYKGLELKELAPLPYMLKLDIDTYLIHFDRILSELNPGDIVNKIMGMTSNKPAILLCYEKPGDFCHRHLVSKWLNKSIGLMIIEHINKAQEPPLTLF